MNASWRNLSIASLRPKELSANDRVYFKSVQYSREKMRLFILDARGIGLVCTKCKCFLYARDTANSLSLASMMTRFSSCAYATAVMFMFHLKL